MFSYSNSIVQNDLREIIKISLDWDDLNNKNILITGANGMIATYLVYVLMNLNVTKGLNIKVFALSRDKEKAKELFNEFWNDPRFCFLKQDVCDPIIINNSLDYIFHFAGNASPYYIKHDPVGIMKSNLIGTLNILELARKQSCCKVIFASTREVYGRNNEVDSLAENSFGYIDCLDSRSCYPESKRAAETLCNSYYTQYGIEYYVVRIAHSYGPGMKLTNDGRIMADLLSCAVNSKNVVLKSTGEALRAFCYITDVITGLFYILFKGKVCSAYNLANETEEISILNLAKSIISICPVENMDIIYDISDENSKIYCDYTRVKLNIDKLYSLGWNPSVKLMDGLKRTIESLTI